MPPLTYNSLSGLSRLAPALTRAHSSAGFAPSRTGAEILRSPRPTPHSMGMGMGTLNGPTSAALMRPVTRGQAPRTSTSAIAPRVPQTQVLRQSPSIPTWAVGAYTYNAAPTSRAYDADAYFAQLKRDQRYQYSGMGFTSTGAGTGASAAGGLFSLAASAIPIVGSLLGPITQMFSSIIGKAGQQKTKATQVVNELEPQLKRNRDAYLAHPSPAMQAAALKNFDDAFTWLSSAAGCGDPTLGAAGQRCISERARGGSAPWCPTGTGCDWFALYRDPIANTAPTLTDAGGAAVGTGTGATGGTGTAAGTNTVSGVLSSQVAGIPVWALAAGALILLGLSMDSGGGSGSGRGRR